MIQVVETKFDVIKRLCVKYHVKCLELFGSIIEGTFESESSDIDFLVEFQPDLDLGPWLTRYFNFRQELEKIFGRKIDLVMISSLENPYFIKEVNRTQRLLYAA